MASIVVVGGGIAGLACAWRLQRAGHDVEVIERESAPGGRMRSEIRGACRIERGARWLSSGFHQTRALVDALGLSDRVRPAARLHAALLADGRFELVDLDAPLSLVAARGLDWRARVGLARLAAEIWRRRRHLDPLHPERDLADDGESAADAVRRLGGDGLHDRLIAPLLEAALDASPAETSYATLLAVLRGAVEGLRLWSLEGGMGGLPATLAERVPVRRGCRATAVETLSGGARVRYRHGERERVVLADAAVVAVPGCDVAALCPGLTPSERAFFEPLRYARGLSAHLMLERAPAGLDFYAAAVTGAARASLRALHVAHHRAGAAPHGAGLLEVALGEEACERLWTADDDAVAAFALEQLARTPVGALHPVRVVVHRWPALRPLFAPGHAARLARLLSARDRSPRLAFAGDALAAPHVEGAVASGLRAASDVVRRLDKDRAR